MSSTYENTCTALGLAIAAQIPSILWGEPGQGKTAVLNALAESNGAELTTVLASIREPSDFAGLPNVVGDRTNLIAPGWAQDIAAANGTSLLFFDEISTAPPSVQAALLRVCLDRVVGDLYLGDKVAIVAAANPPEIAADGWDLAPPMANRFIHLDWALPADVVRDGFSIGWPEVSVPELDTDRVAKAIIESKVLVGAFIGARPDLLSQMPQDSAESGRAFPTPRSWENAAILYGHAEAAGSNGVVKRILLNGTVGQGAAAEFLAYVSDLDLPDPEAVLKAPKKWTVPSRGDKVYATAASVLAVVQADLTDERWKACGDVVARMVSEGHSDIAVSVAIKWLGLRPSPSVRPNGESLKTLAPVLKEAGRLPS